MNSHTQQQHTQGSPTLWGLGRVVYINLTPTSKVERLFPIDPRLKEKIVRVRIHTRKKKEEKFEKHIQLISALPREESI